MDYRLVFLIGRGSFGEIYLGEKKGEAPTAVKIVNLDKMSDEYSLLLTEIQILTKNKCKYLLQCKKVEISNDARNNNNLLYITMPYFKNGDLESEINRTIVEDNPEAIIITSPGILNLTKTFSDRFNIPIVEGVTAAATLLETLSKQGLKIKRFTNPPNKNYGIPI